MEGTRVSPICVIAPTDKILHQSQLIIQKYNKNVDVFKGSIVNAAEVVKDLMGRGGTIFISRRGTKCYIEKSLQVQTVEIQQNLADYMPFMESAAKVKGRVAIFRYGQISEDLRAMCMMLHIDAKHYCFTNRHDCEEAVKAAVEDGAIFGIGGADSEYFSRKYGLEHVVVENSESSLLIALEQAEQLLQLKIEEQLKQHKLRMLLERYEMIFNYTHDAIIAVDEAGQVVVLNERAEQIIRHVPKPYVGRAIDEIIPNSRMKVVLSKGRRELNQLMSINGTMVSTNRIPIIVDNEIVGAVATFQDVKSLQDSEKKIRLKLHEKGLVAKYHFDDIIGKSEKIKANITLANKFAKSDATILIQGETGTGKELFAQSIHNASRRADGPFVAVNCGALPRNLLEAELFGYVEGSFTGAMKGGKAGLFEMAHAGTIFLDEIGELPLDTQVQLLRVLQEKEVRRIGSDRVLPVDVRVITATNRNLLKGIEEGVFREDLYYRLNVLNIMIPPLRERGSDVIEIGLSIYKSYVGLGEVDELEFVRDILRKMQDYSWPGNVRELHNLIERIRILIAQKEEKDFIERCVNSYFVPSVIEREKGNEENIVTGRKAREEEERAKILKALKENDMEMIRTADALGISRSTLWRKIRKYQLNYVLHVSDSQE